MPESMDIVERLRMIARQCGQMQDQASFGGEGVGVRVKDPAFLVESATEAADLIATLRAAVEQEREWQPIETAPHNKAVLLGWEDWRDGAWAMNVGPASTGVRNEVASSISHHGSATHWQPLPAPPAIRSRKGER